MTRTGVLGFPVEHSRSPAMFNAAFKALGMDDWSYAKLPVAPELFDETVRGLPGSGYCGANVTLPHKQAALALADEASAAARAIGAANTLTFAGGGIVADNTDAPGLLGALEAEGASPAGSKALVLGAGGAGRAAAWALKDAGASQVLVWNRTLARASALADELGLSYVEWPEPCDLLVNATSVGLNGSGDLRQLGLLELEPPPVVVDLVYSTSGSTPVQDWGERGGSTVVDGLEILVRQGALSFRIWTGTEPPLDVMRDAALGLDP